MEDITDIPLQRNPVILVRSVVRSRKLGSNNQSTCRISPNGFQFYDKNSIELFRTEEEDASHVNTTQDDLDEDVHGPCEPIYPSVSQANEDIEEQDIDRP